ncbi:hypothetical protein [Glaesserella sp.]|uniref:hypothetical protein n=1 Tax=Glaesserella sp. TaxID=2094731 RepID=UPI0035A06D2B
MAYQTGTAESAQMLLDELGHFIHRSGWKVERSVRALHLTHQNGKDKWVIEHADGIIYTVPCTEFRIGASALAQLGTPAIAGNAVEAIHTRTTELGKGNFVSYDFFVTPEYIHVVVEIEADRFRHFGVGLLQKEMEFVGGQYAYGTSMYSQYESSVNAAYNSYGVGSGTRRHSAVLRADGLGGDTHSPRYFVATNQYSSSSKKAENLGFAMYALGRAGMPNDDYTSHPSKYLVKYSQSKFGQTLIPAPNVILAHLLDNTVVRLGIIPDRYECTMQGIPPKTIMEIAGERWKIIPAAQYNPLGTSNSTGDRDNTGFHGVAYRIVE